MNVSRHEMSPAVFYSDSLVGVALFAQTNDFKR